MICSSNIKIIVDDKISLYEFFPKCQLQIGVYSTAIAEGIGFDLDTIILKVDDYHSVYSKWIITEMKSYTVGLESIFRRLTMEEK